MNSRLSRQSFLGATSDETLGSIKVGVVGLGGGGSHIVQQLAHVGVGHFVLFDHDRMDETNLNRLVGGTASDVKKHEWKAAIAARQLRRISPTAKVVQVRKKWQERAELLRDCATIFGCVDSFAERDQLETAARRYLTPYIDMGMDVIADAEAFAIVGQVALSMPDHPCLRCMGIIRDETLNEEAKRYGVAGGRPQVVWPNGILASTAVGVFIQLVTPWHGTHPESELLEYDGNSHQITRSSVLGLISPECPHFRNANSIGDPWFRVE